MKKTTSKKNVSRESANEIKTIDQKTAVNPLIQAELELPVGTKMPELDVWERPEQAFVVKDEEVKVERVLTDEQQAQLDEERRLEELRRAAGGDNWRDRGLKDMMDGVIEVEEDVLKQTFRCRVHERSRAPRVRLDRQL